MISTAIVPDILPKPITVTHGLSIKVLLRAIFAEICMCQASVQHSTLLAHRNILAECTQYETVTLTTTEYPKLDAKVTAVGNSP